MRCTEYLGDRVESALQRTQAANDTNTSALMSRQIGSYVMSELWAMRDPLESVVCDHMKTDIELVGETI
jgi:hypothetical protein